MMRPLNSVISRSSQRLTIVPARGEILALQNVTLLRFLTFVRNDRGGDGRNDSGGAIEMTSREDFQVPCHSRPRSGIQFFAQFPLDSRRSLSRT